MLDDVIDRYLRDEISAPIAIMELLLLTWDSDQVLEAIAARDDDSAPIGAMRELAIAHVAGCEEIAEMLRTELDDPEPATSVEEGIARTRRLFDDAVTRNAEASVAMYSLGSPALLARATTEVVAVFDAWGALGPARDALEIGCGIGRLLVPLAGRLHSIVGVDVSPRMIEACTERVAGLANVRVLETDGRDLRAIASRSLDLVYSVDAFPYLVLSGRALVATHLQEIARVLRPGGQLVIFNYAYGRSRALDTAEVAELAEAAGLNVLRSDETPFRLWNAVGFLLGLA